ncbi:MAG: hypothetical protein AB8G95_00840 [Anaerolineae bacterium]
MQKIGPLQLTELPEKYQDQFESGEIGPNGRFYPFVPSEGSLLTAILFSVIYIVPALGLMFYAIPYYLSRNPEVIAENIRTSITGLGPFLVLMVIFGVVFGGLFWMLWQGWLSLKNVYVWFFHTRPQEPLGPGLHGILIDLENLVIRHGDSFADFSCAFLPKESITQSFTSTLRIRTEADKHARFVDVVKVRFVNEEKQSDEIVLYEVFSLKADELQQVISSWRQA